MRRNVNIKLKLRIYNFTVGIIVLSKSYLNIEIISLICIVFIKYKISIFEVIFI